MNPTDERHPTHQVPEPPLRGPFGMTALSLGRILGIRVGLDPSWFVIFTLVAYALGESFREEHTNWPVNFAWLAGLLCSLLYFLSILLHELGHCVVARALGVPIRSITLFICGGVASMGREPENPRDEFLIAVAGPIVSFFLSGGFFLAAVVCSEAAKVQPDALLWQALGAVSFALGSVNFLLIVFNAIPGFPLDGGRVLRSFIWAGTGDYALATKIAAGAGSAFAATLMAVGVLVGLLWGEPTQGVLLVVMGWFLLRASRASLVYMKVKEGLSRRLVGDACERELPRVAGRTSVQSFLEGPIQRQGLHALFVDNDGTLVGVVTAGMALGVAPEERMNTPVQAIAIPFEALESVSPSETLWAALQKMESAGSGALPVMEGGALVGVVTRDGLIRAMRTP